MSGCGFLWVGAGVWGVRGVDVGVRVGGVVVEGMLYFCFVSIVRRVFVCCFVCSFVVVLVVAFRGSLIYFPWLLCLAAQL